MRCFQLVGSKRGHVIDPPFAAYQSCLANGTVADLDDPNYAHWPGSTAPRPAAPAPQVPEAPAKEVNLGLTIPLFMPDSGIGFLDLPAMDRPEDIGTITFIKFSGHESVPDGIYCENGWPKVIEFAVELLNDEEFKLDSEGRLEISATNGIALYHPIGVLNIDNRNCFAEFLEGSFTPIPDRIEGEKQSSKASDETAKTIDIPEDWMDQHHNWKRARAAEISGKDVGSKAEAEEIIKAYLAEK